MAKTVVVMLDYRDNGDRLSLLLGDNFIVHFFEDAEAALAFLMGNPVALFVGDLSLSGRGVSGLLLQLPESPFFSDLKMIIYTEKELSTFVLRRLWTSLDIIYKPVDLEILAKKIKGLFGESHD